MARFALIAATLLGNAASASTLDYGFDGVLAEHFQPIPDYGLAPEFDQNRDRLELHTAGEAVASQGGAALLHTEFRPGYDASWKIAAEVTIPLAYDLPSDPPSGSDGLVTAGIAAIFAPSGEIDDPAAQLFGTALEVHRMAPTFETRRALMLADQNFSLVATETVLETVHLCIEFDAPTRTLRALANAEELIAIPIDGRQGIDWGMNPADHFFVGVFGDAHQVAVGADDPISLDDFQATQRVPEPTLGIVSLAPFLAACTRRRRAVEAVRARA